MKIATSHLRAEALRRYRLKHANDKQYEPPVQPEKKKSNGAESGQVKDESLVKKQSDIDKNITERRETFSREKVLPPIQPQSRDYTNDTSVITDKGDQTHNKDHTVILLQSDDLGLTNKEKQKINLKEIVPESNKSNTASNPLSAKPNVVEIDIPTLSLKGVVYTENMDTSSLESDQRSDSTDVENMTLDSAELLQDTPIEFVCDPAVYSSYVDQIEEEVSNINGKSVTRIDEPGSDKTIPMGMDIYKPMKSIQTDPTMAVKESDDTMYKHRHDRTDQSLEVETEEYLSFVVTRESTGGGRLLSTQFWLLLSAISANTVYSMLNLLLIHNLNDWFT